MKGKNKRMTDEADNVVPFRRPPPPLGVALKELELREDAGKDPFDLAEEGVAAIERELGCRFDLHQRIAVERILAEYCCRAWNIAARTWDCDRGVDYDPPPISA